MKRLTAGLITVIVLGIAGGAAAYIPSVFSYQGVLTDGAGAAVADGPYEMTFRLYTTEVGGSPFWEETQTVSVAKGIFNVRLGTYVSIYALGFDEPYYLGISVEGGAELSPRQLLTPAPYSLNSLQVRGTNLFHAEGDVGIGTASPLYKLHIRHDDSGSNPAMCLDNNYGLGSQNIIDFRFDGATQARIRKANNGNLFIGTIPITGGITLRTNDTNRLTILSNGRTGIGIDSPVELLDVAGGVRIGNSTGTNAGTMRWNGSDFQGYDGSTWKSLTATGGGSLPAGSSGQTLRHDGASWIATSSLHNSGSAVGIGTTAPSSRLHLEGGTSVEEILINQTSSTASARVRLKTSGGAYDHLAIQKYAATSGSSIDGISLDDMSLIDAGINGGAMMLRVASNNPMYFLTNNQERMRLTSNGNLGINTKAPGAKLHVDGNMWDLTNTEGDFKIGNETHRLKFGVATGGAGAGTAGIRVAGGAEKLILGGGSAEVLSVDGAGNTSIGGPTSRAKLRLFRSGVDSAVVYAFTNSNGGNINLYDENHNLTAFMQADGSGEGGYLAVYRGPGQSGFLVDGNYAGTNSANVTVLGETSSASIRTDVSGNLSVTLPVSAIESGEMLNEPGVTSAVEGTFSTSLPSGDISTIISRSIVTPAAGYVLVIGTAQLSTEHVTGTNNYCNIGVSESAAGYSDNQDVAIQLPAALPNGFYYFPASVHGLFSAPAAGTHTYYLLGNPGSSSQTWNAQDVQLTLLYIPTSYGTVEPTVATASEASDDAAPVVQPMSAGAMAAERTESEAANAARIERELAAMRAELEAVKAQMEDK